MRVTINVEIGHIPGTAVARYSSDAGAINIIVDETRARDISTLKAVLRHELFHVAEEVLRRYLTT